MKNKPIKLLAWLDNLSVRRLSSRSKVFSVFIIVIFLLSSLTSCKAGNTSRWKMDGNSMEPNLNDGQIVEAEPINDLSTLSRGDIIVFKWNDRLLLKRLIALPGEIIEIREGHIIIDGKIYDEPYKVALLEYKREPLKLGKNEYYLLGDNRNESADSHAFGPITGEMIEARVIP